MDVSMPTLCENHRCNKRAKNERKNKINHTPIEMKYTDLQRSERV